MLMNSFFYENKFLKNIIANIVLFHEFVRNNIISTLSIVADNKLSQQLLNNFVNMCLTYVNNNNNNNNIALSY